MIPLEVIALSPYAREWAAQQARRRVRRPIRDRLGRSIELGEWEPEDGAGLLAMYRSFDAAPSGTTPPLNAERRAVWVEQLLSRGPNVVARASGRIIGHAALVAYDRGDSHELVVFVHRDYRGAGIGGALVDTLLQVARRQGVDRIWLTVDRENHSAAALFFARGFRIGRDGSAESSAAASWGLDVWTLALSDAPRTRSTPRTRPIGRAVVDALRFVMIPLVCALVIAIASEDSRGRVLAIGLALVSVGFGLVVQSRTIIVGRPSGRAPEEPVMSTAEWMAKLR